MALVAASTSVLPATARVDSGTSNLIRTAERYGATFVDGTNSPDCTPGIHGWYIHSDKTIVICTMDNLNAETYDTVRHEVFHFIQGCQSSGAGLDPLIKNRRNFIHFVEGSLTPRQIDSIKMTYPQGKWAIEMEAFAMADDMTAATLTNYLHKYCG